MQTTPLSQETQETKVACLNGVKETEYKLSDVDLSVLSARLMLLVTNQLHQRESQNNDSNNQYDPQLLRRLDYPAR